MNESIREQLLGYVLGALDEHEHRFVEGRIACDPAWQQQLEEIQKSLEPLADAYEEFEPPAGLSEKTCRFVAEESERLEVVRPCRTPFAMEGGFDTRSRWRMADWIVLSGICAAAVALFFPAILNSRFSARVAMCQNNLRELGQALTQFSERTQERFFPAIPTQGNRAFAGYYAPQLQACTLLPEPRILVCPESSLAGRMNGFRVPSIPEIDQADMNDVVPLQRDAGGSYSFTVGFVANGRHCTARNRGRTHYAIMADSPALEWGKPVHGNGLNVLYEDMHIAHVINHAGMRLIDDPFRNHAGLPEAGTHQDDAVVAPSYSPPLWTNISRIVDER